MFERRDDELTKQQRTERHEQFVESVEQSMAEFRAGNVQQYESVAALMAAITAEEDDDQEADADDHLDE